MTQIPENLLEAIDNGDEIPTENLDEGKKKEYAGENCEDGEKEMDEACDKEDADDDVLDEMKDDVLDEMKDDEEMDEMKHDDEEMDEMKDHKKEMKYDEDGEMREAKGLTTPQKHQLKIAKDTLKMSDAGALVMGGMTKDEAREFLRSVGYSAKRIAKLEESALDQIDVLGNVEQMSEEELDDAVRIVFGEDLDSDLADKAKLVFEAAVRDRLASLAPKLEEHINTQIDEIRSELEEETEAHRQELTENVHKYVTHAVRTWAQENEVSMVESTRADLTESFIEGLRDLCVRHHIDLPESKVDVVEDLTNRLEEAEAQLNEALGEIAEKEEILEQHTKNEIVESVSKSLSLSQRQRLVNMVEHMEMESVDTFRSAVETLAENYFGDGGESEDTTILNESKNSEIPDMGTDNEVSKALETLTEDKIDSDNTQIDPDVAQFARRM